MTTTEAWLILALWLTLARGSRVYQPAPPATRLPRSHRPLRPQTPA